VAVAVETQLVQMVSLELQTQAVEAVQQLEIVVAEAVMVVMADQAL
jgi:hypothetical protein